MTHEIELLDLGGSFGTVTVNKVSVDSKLGSNSSKLSHILPKTLI